MLQAVRGEYQRISVRALALSAKPEYSYSPDQSLLAGELARTHYQLPRGASVNALTVGSIACRRTTRICTATTEARCQRCTAVAVLAEVPAEVRSPRWIAIADDLLDILAIRIPIAVVIQPIVAGAATGSCTSAPQFLAEQCESDERKNEYCRFGTAAHRNLTLVFYIYLSQNFCSGDSLCNEHRTFRR